MHNLKILPVALLTNPPTWSAKLSFFAIVNAVEDTYIFFY